MTRRVATGGVVMVALVLAGCTNDGAPGPVHRGRHRRPGRRRMEAVHGRCGRHRAHLARGTLGTAQLDRAVVAGRGVVDAVTTLRRTGFDTDYDQALTLTTGYLRGDLQGHRAQTQRAPNSGGFDLLSDVGSCSRSTVC